MVDFVSKPRYDVNDLKILIKLLCGPEGCPWDREQTHESIRRNMLEEAYETADAIDRKNTQDLIEELGDVLMQVVFHADIAERADTFSLEDIADATCKKLIRRHPHVFGNVKANNGKESLVVWDAMKREEKQHESISDAMKSIARILPALWRTEKIQAKAAKAGFDRQDYTEALDSLRAKIDEFENAAIDSKAESGHDQKTATAIKEKFGDMLFSIVNAARFFDIDPEEALENSNRKFISLFARLEQKAAEQNKKIADMTFNEIREVNPLL